VLDSGKILNVAHKLGTECEAVLQDGNGRIFFPTDVGEIVVVGMKEALDQTQFWRTASGIGVEYVEKRGQDALTYEEWLNPFMATEALRHSGYSVVMPFDEQGIVVKARISGPGEHCMN